ncbi:hypothetical protein RclHR1_15140002 [Rhizophagus clarus]|uniref:Uncharacterized protein n=1 Tax=Rhizophagus clarus TaxID=94130 RepID=A0A2Z6QV73_9GLOM|nr:hypothetical protein RclHR1_15140002 [Rhizophagus clarus]GES92322.1 hypothetical protein GLOIN_2v1883665 [Rhizophagus clarus]
MDQNHDLKDQFLDPQPNFNNHTFQSIPEQGPPCPSYMTSSQNVTIEHQQTFGQNNFIVDQQNLPVYYFYYQPPNDHCNYHICCKEISFHKAIQLLNESFNDNINSNQYEYIFFYHQQSNGKIYQIACEIVIPSLILNKAIYGIDINHNFEQENIFFTFNQKENLKFYLTQYLKPLLY